MAFLLYLKWFSRKRKNSNSSQDVDGIPEHHTSVQRYLEHYKVGEDAICVVERCVEYETPDDYLRQHGVSENSIQFYEAEIKAEARHRRNSRSVILWVLAAPMSVIPIWIMVLLTIPIFHKEADIPQSMQAAYLVAVASDFGGLYYIITRDLFPQGGNSSSNQGRNRDDDEDDEGER